MPARVTVSVAATLLLATPAVAAADPDSGVSAFTWSAPARCPDRSWALRSIENLLGRGALPPRLEARVSLSPSPSNPARFEARLAMPGMGATGERRFEGSSCESAAQAAVLVVAMAVDPTDVAETVVPRTARPPTTSVGLGVVISADAGSLPEPTLGGGPTLSLRHDRLFIEATGIAWLPRVQLKEPGSGSGGEIGLSSATLRACLDLADLASAGLRIGGCVAAEAGVTVGHGIGVRAPATSHGFWGAALAGISVRAVTGVLRPSLLLEAGAPYPRPTFDIEGLGDVFRSSAVIARASIAMAWTFP